MYTIMKILLRNKRLSIIYLLYKQNAVLTLSINFMLFIIKRYIHNKVIG
jgi:hypothetical protein